MPIASLLIAALLSPSAALAAPSQNPAATARVDQALSVFKAGLEEVQACFNSEDSLREDYARKKQQFSQEYRGRIPPELAELLGVKTARIEKVHVACSSKYAQLNQPFVQVRDSFIGIDPRVVDIHRQQAAYQALTSRYRAIDRGHKRNGPTAPSTSHASPSAGGQE